MDLARIGYSDRIMIIPIFAVKDIASSKAFYVDNLEFKLEFEMPGPDGPSFAMLSVKPGTMIGISRQDAPEPKGQGVVSMIYVDDTTDIDAYYERVKSRGTTITSEIKDEYWGDRCFLVQDPDGFCINLCKTIRQVTAEEAIAASQSG